MPLPFEDSPVKKTAKKKAVPDSAVARLFDVYHACFRRKWNACAAHHALACKKCGDEWAPRFPAEEIKPLYEGGRDAKSFKDLKDAWGEEVVAQLIRDFFASTDPQIVRSDYKVQVLKMHAQRLRLLSRGTHHSDARTAQNVDAASRALRKS